MVPSQMDKLIVLLTAAREMAIMIVASIEDYLDVPYDRSALAKRRVKPRQYHGQEISG